MSKPNQTRRTFLKTTALGTASLLLGQISCKDSNQSQKPNFIFILIDDLGWKDVGFMGSTYYETPNIDRLARDGMTFSNAYANAPNCAPTRACLLSGLYTPRHCVYTVNNSDRGKPFLRKLIPTPNTKILAPHFTTFAEVLKKSGYTCASIGKWHLGEYPGTGPLIQGFDVNVGGNHLGHPKSYFSPYKNKFLPDGLEGEYLTDRLTDETLQFLEQNKKKPFFIYLPHYAVHTPIQAKEKLIEKYTKKEGSYGQNNPAYAAMIESTDTGVGRILAKLEELQLTDNTIVFFFSDNGGVRRITSMEPLRGGKGMLYEGGIRVPCIIKWPGQTRPGSECQIPIVSTDFYPTILQMAGLNKPENVLLDGESIAPLLTGKSGLKRKAIFWHFPAYLQGKAKGARDPYFRTRPGGVVRMGDWKLIEYFEDGDFELYNLKNDIGEKNNLAEEKPDKVKELHEVMSDWRKSVNAPVPTEKNPDYNSKQDKGL
ncbi:sulfatase [candidate division KSB1 bacterium]|nr:sulfatase [candidate division KSB1 bacterium]